MRAIVEKAIPNAQVALVFSNNPNAPGLKWASERGLRVACIPSKGRMDRAAYDQEVAAAIARSWGSVPLSAGSSAG